MDETAFDGTTREQAEYLVDVGVMDEDALSPVQVLNADLGPVLGSRSHVVAVRPKQMPDLDALPSLRFRMYLFDRAVA